MDSRQRSAKITAIATYLPAQILSNKDLEKIVDTTDEWIIQRTGIEERRIAARNETTSDMGTKAVEKLCHESHIDPKTIDFIIVATMTPDTLASSTAAMIQDRIGALNAASLDIQAACAGFLYALSVAKAYVTSGMYRRIVVVAAEKMSSITDYTDRGTCILFGDAASAVLVESQGAGYEIEHLLLGSDGSASELITIPAGGVRMPATKETVENRKHYIHLEGKEVFKHAIKCMANACLECLAYLQISQEHIRWLVPHQANRRIIDALAKKLEFPEAKIIKTIAKYGNTSASSIPLALSEVIKNYQTFSGERILLTAFGAGLTWGAGVIKKIDE